MCKKLTIEFIRETFEKDGCTLLTTEYLNNKQILSIRLINGDEYDTTWLSWQQGKRPWRASQNLQPTIDEIYKSFSAKGYILLSKEYINSKTKLEFICDRGHKHSMLWSSWKNGHICKYCNYENRRNKPKYKYKSDSDIKVDGIIYKVTNKINGKIYIGQTIQTLHKRKISHFSSANRDKIVNHFHRALNKYGKNNFNWKTLEYCNSKEELDDMEFHYIKQYHSYKNGYNMTIGGEGTLGRVCKESTKRKISEAKVGVKASKKTKKKLSDMRRGVKKSKEHVAKVAAAKSKYWEITYPNGNVKIIKNLSKFCRKNDLSDRGMWMVANNIRTHHKKFKCKKVNNTGVTL